MLTEDQIDCIAERAAEKAVAKLTEQIYQEIGRSVVKKALWLIGVVVVGLAVAFKAKNWI